MAEQAQQSHGLSEAQLRAAARFVLSLQEACRAASMLSKLLSGSEMEQVAELAGALSSLTEDMQRTYASALSGVAWREAQLGETEAWGLFDSDDLSAEQPFPIATFESETDARGFAFLKAFVDAPVVRLCKVRGSVQLDVAPNDATVAEVMR